MLPNVAQSSLRKKLGVFLITLGLAGILWGVFHILEATQGAERGRRQTYNQVKPRLQHAFPGGLLRSLAGLGVAMIGGRVLAKGREREA